MPLLCFTATRSAAAGDVALLDVDPEVVTRQRVPMLAVRVVGVIPAPASLRLVGSVASIRSEVQVLGVAARRIVAGVADLLTLREVRPHTVSEHVGEDMGTHRPPTKAEGS